MNATTYPNVYHGALLDEIIHEQKLSADLVKRAAREVFVIIKEGLLRDGVVRINHFGTFKLKRVAAREGHNPQTGKPMIIAGHAKVIFSPCKALREMIEPNHPKPIPVPLAVTEPAQAREPLQPLPELTPTAALLKSESEAQTIIERVTGLGEEAPKGRKWGSHEKIIYFGIAATIIAMVVIKSMPRKVESIPTPQQLTIPQVSETTVVEPMEVTVPEFKPVEEMPALATAETLPAEIAERAAMEPEVMEPEVMEPEAESELAQIIASQSQQQRVELEVAATQTVAPSPEERGADTAGATTQIAEPPVAAVTVVEAETVSKEPPVVASAEPIPATAETPFFTERPYQLQSGNSLWRLAKHFYSEPLYWPHIYYANADRITNPDKLYAGRTLTLPALEGNPGNLTTHDREGIAEGYFLTYLFYKENGRADAFFALLEAKRYSAEVVERKRHILKLSAIENIMLDQQEMVANL